MGLAYEYLAGQTPLNNDEKEGLRIKTIATRGELDEFEQLNIEQAVLWTLSRSFKTEEILTEEFIKLLHKKMYADVWTWAGDFRKSDKNIGVDKWQIGAALKSLLDDTHYWITNSTYPPNEIAIRFKHRLVSIHCFPNGNGRHSRLMADILIQKIFKHPVFSWGATKENGRALYLQAVRAGDVGDIVSLIDFARS